MVSKKVFCCCGLTVLILLKARPTRPLDCVSVTKEPETAEASSTAWFVAVAPPMLTVSVPTTLPVAFEPSPNVMANVLPLSALNVCDLVGSKIVWPVCSFAGSEVLKSHLSLG